MANGQEMAPDRPDKRETAEELKRIKKEAQSFSNPLIDPSTEQLSALSTKERRSIEKRIANRKVKIDTILSELESAETADALRKLLFDGNKITDISKLLVEQAEIAEKSRGVFAHKPFQDSVLAIGQFGKTLLERVPTQEPDEPPAILQQLRGLIPSLTEQKPPTTDTAEQKPSKGGQTEESHPQQDNQEKAPTFDDVETVEELVRQLRRTPTWETKIERGKNQRLDIVANREIARTLEERVAEFEAMRTARNPRTGLKAREFVTSFVNLSLRDAVRRALIARGFLSARGKHEPSSPEETTTLPQGEKVKETSRPGAERTAIVKEGELLKQVLERVVATPFLDAVRGKKIIQVEGKTIAKGIRTLVRDFQSDDAFKSLPKEARTKEILTAIDTLTTNLELRGDLHAAFREMGLLEGETRSQKERQEAIPPPVGGKGEAASLGGVATHEFFAELRRRISQAKREGESDRTLGIEYANLVKMFQYFGSAAFREKQIQGRKQEVEQFLNTLPAKLRESVKEVLEKDKIIEGVAIAETPRITPVLQPRATIERQPSTRKAPEVEKPETPAEALSDYFKKVESGTDFLQRIVNMPEDDELRGSMQLSELERLSGELSQKVIDFFALIETWEKDKKSAKEMGQSSEEFISSHRIPSGCQTAFRAIASFAINKILGPVAETLKAHRKTEPAAPPPPPPPPPAPTTGGAAEGLSSFYRPRSVDEVLDELVTGAPASAPASAHATPQATEATPATESPKAAPASEGEAESFLERVRARGSRLWNPTRTSTPKAAAPASPKPPEAAVLTPSPAPTSAPEAVPTPPAVAASPEKPVAPAIPGKFSEEIAKSWTRDQIREHIKTLTFENLADLSDNYLRTAVRSSRTTSFGWGIAMKGMPEDFVRRVRSFVDEADFDVGINRHEDKFLTESRKSAVKTSQEKMLKDLDEGAYPWR